jgi:hypothetical protein
MKIRKIQLDDNVTFLVEVLDGEFAGQWTTQWAGCLNDTAPFEDFRPTFTGDVPGQRLYDLCLERMKAPYEEWTYTELHDFDDGLGPRELFDDDDDNP